MAQARSPSMRRDRFSPWSGRAPIPAAGVAAPCEEPTVVGILAPERRVIADSLEGKPLGRLNDLVADKKGGVYFTSGGAYYSDAVGRVTSLGDDLRTNGIILSRD